MEPLSVSRPVLDCCGTGGDGANTINISTTAAIIAAAAGAPIAKHGNRAVTSKSGSSDVLAALGVNIEASFAQVVRCIDEANIGFLFAPRHHSAMRHVAKTRAELGFRTMFNLLGPLSNPASASRQLIGVYAASLMERMGRAAWTLGAERVLVVHGSDGLDELTITGPSEALLFEDADPEGMTIHPDRVGLTLAPASAIKGGDADENAAIIGRIFDGEPGAPRDVCILNAGAIIWLAGIERTLDNGVQRAAEAIDRGDAKSTLDKLITISNGS
jgi:anthranilate phosphoribosyltransferase